MNQGTATKPTRTTKETTGKKRRVRNEIERDGDVVDRMSMIGFPQKNNGQGDGNTLIDPDTGNIFRTTENKDWGFQSVSADDLDAAGTEDFQPTKVRLIHGSDNSRMLPTYDVGYNIGNVPKAVIGATAEIPTNVSPELYTSKHIYDDVDVRKDIPAILFMLTPGENPFEGVKHVPLLADREGNIVRSAKGHALRFFSFLPRHISTKVEAVLLEFWFRIDSRLEMSDVADRMATQVSRNTLNQQRNRYRKALNVMNWWPGQHHITQAEAEVLNAMQPMQISLNTTMPIWVTRDGAGQIRRKLLKPQLYDEGPNIAGYMPVALDLEFLVRAVAPQTVPGQRLRQCMEMRKELQRLAIKGGLGRGRDSWLRIPKELLPPWWKTQKGKGNGSDKNKDLLEEARFDRG